MCPRWADLVIFWSHVLRCPQAWFGIPKCRVGPAALGFSSTFGSQRSGDFAGFVFSHSLRMMLRSVKIRITDMEQVWTCMNKCCIQVLYTSVLSCFITLYHVVSLNVHVVSLNVHVQWWHPEHPWATSVLMLGLLEERTFSCVIVMLFWEQVPT